MRLHVELRPASEGYCNACHAKEGKMWAIVAGGLVMTLCNDCMMQVVIQTVPAPPDSAKEGEPQWQCPKCGAFKSVQIPPFHYCQLTGHHEQMTKVGFPAKPPAEPGIEERWVCDECKAIVIADDVIEPCEEYMEFSHMVDGFTCGPVVRREEKP